MFTAAFPAQLFVYCIIIKESEGDGFWIMFYFLATDELTRILLVNLPAKKSFLESHFLQRLSGVLPGKDAAQKIILCTYLHSFNQLPN